MNVSLTPELENRVQAKLATGLYRSSSELVRDALRLLHEYEGERMRRLEDLRGDLQVALEQLKAGKGRAFDTSLVQEIKQRGRARLYG